ncbi:MAG: sigma-70 family RNA polymerase sigma factor [Rikenellaceae bacterium]
MSTLKISDNQLLQSYRAGDTTAISTLIERHTPRIRNYIRLMVKDSDRAEDILQETFIKSIKMIDEGRYTDNGRLLSWMLRIAHNLSIDYFRSQKSRPVTNEADAGYDILGAQSHTESAPEEQIITNETHQQVRDLVELLPEDQREVVQLRYYSDLSFREIAEHTGVSINTALGRMRYALINLRKLIKERRVALA